MPSPNQADGQDFFEALAARLGGLLGRSRYGFAPLLGICLFFICRQDLLAAVHNSPWCQFTDLGLLALYIASGPTRLEALCTAMAGVGLTWAIGFPATFAYPGGQVVTAGAYMGIAGVVALVWRCPRDANAPRMLLRAFAFLGMGSCISQLLVLNSRVAAWKLDLYLYDLDLKLAGFAPSFALAASRFQAYLRPTELLIYYALPFATAAVYAGHIRRGGPRATNFALIAIGNMLIGYCAYLFYPAAGPAYAFADVFPRMAPVVGGLHAVAIAAPANAMPSLHLSAALLIWWNSRHWRWARWLALAFLALTILATIGLGEHYCMDLVVAVPYALFIQALGTRRPLQITCLATGLSMTVVWLVLLRYGFPLLTASSLLLRMGAVATVCVPLWLGHGLLSEAVELDVERRRQAAVVTCAERLPAHGECISPVL